MSMYTTEVRYICEHYAGLDESKGYNEVSDIIKKARRKVFDFYYPIFDEDYREVLETKILKHYYTREIGFETVGLWKLKLDTLMNEIMPYYNKMYESELLEFDPFKDVNKRVEHEGSDRGTKNTDADSTTNTTGTVNYEGETDTWNLYSDTPQGGVDGIVAAYDDIADNAYLTDARNIKTTEENETNTTGEDVTVSNVDEEHENSNKWVEITTGKYGTLTYSKMLEEFRQTFLNIDLMIIEELSELFFMLW